MPSPARFISSGLGNRLQVLQRFRPTDLAATLAPEEFCLLLIDLLQFAVDLLNVASVGLINKTAVRTLRCRGMYRIAPFALFDAINHIL